MSSPARVVVIVASLAPFVNGIKLKWSNRFANASNVLDFEFGQCLINFVLLATNMIMISCGDPRAVSLPKLYHLSLDPKSVCKISWKSVI